MNRGHVLQSSVVQQQMMGGNPNSSSSWWNNTMHPPNYYSHQEAASPSHFLTPYAPTTAASSLPSPSWLDNQHLPHSWSHLLMSGLVCEEDKADMCHQVPPVVVDVKQESLVYDGHGRQDLIQAAKTTNWSQVLEPPHAAAASPKSCVTGFSSSSMLDFSNTDAMPSPPDPSSSECNSTGAGGAFKKARVQPSTTQSTIKVRKEKLGDRITALHQIVSPFGKTDTASVLLEAIGYIRFLQSQIEALSLPYLGSGSGNMRHQHQQQHSVTNTNVQGEKNCIFPEDSGQLLNENCLKRKAASEQDCEEEAKKDLRSRGLCLVPVSCTLQVGSDNNINGADYWAPPAFSGGFL